MTKTQLAPFTEGVDVSSASLTSGKSILGITSRLLAGNVLWNLSGSIAPLALGIAVMPALVRSLGTDRFGVLSLAWTLIGYVSLFDFGLGRALTKAIAERLGSGQTSDIPEVFWNSLMLLFGFGCAVATALFFLATPFTTSVLRVPAALLPETVTSFRWIALAVPAVTLASGLRGFLEARQAFNSVNMVRVLIGCLGFVGPWIAIEISGRLSEAVFFLAVTRLVGVLVYGFFVYRAMPELFSQVRLDKSCLAPILRFSGWITIDNLMSPLMSSMDRFVVSSILTISVVAYYATPSDIVLRLLVIPTAIQSVIFSAFSRSAIYEPERARRLYHCALETIIFAILPLVAGAILFAHEGLQIWLGKRFAENSSLILQIMAVGLLINAAAHVPSAYLQSIGRPDLNVRIHAIEFPIYCVCAYFFTLRFGIAGAAAAWVLRVAIDAALFFYFVRRWMPTVQLKPLVILSLVSMLGTTLLLVIFHAGFALRVLVEICIALSAFLIMLPTFRTILWARSAQ